jgi:NAD(P)-dependent dehydrogenase (short-subunit alcohol dehydrogenase family)
MFTDKVFLITGAANGIGLATARALHARGAAVILWDVDEASLVTAVAAIPGARCAVVDVTQPEAISRALQTVDRLDGVVHSAGIARAGMFEGVALEQHRRVIEINLFGTLAVAHAVLPKLRQSQGSLVMVSSVSAFYGPPEFSSYAATKAGVLNFAQLLRIELAHNGVHVGVICPHFVDTALYRDESAKSAMSRANPLLIELRTADQIASAIVRGIEGRRFMIWSSWKARVLYWYSRYGDFAAHLVMTKIWRDAGGKPTS